MRLVFEKKKKKKKIKRCLFWKNTFSQDLVFLFSFIFLEIFLMRLFYF